MYKYDTGLVTLVAIESRNLRGISNFYKNVGYHARVCDIELVHGENVEVTFFVADDDDKKNPNFTESTYILDHRCQWIRTTLLDVHDVVLENKSMDNIIVNVLLIGQ